MGEMTPKDWLQRTIQDYNDDRMAGDLWHHEANDYILSTIRAALQAEREASYCRGYNDGWADFKKQCAMKDGCELAAIERGEVLTQEEMRERGKEKK